MSEKRTLTTTRITSDPNYWLGFDVAKAKLDWSPINRQGIEQTYGKITNTVTEIATLLLAVAGNYPTATIRCVVEATSTYHYALLEACQPVDMQCIAYNAILTRQQINGSIRGKKTDRSDAFLVARVGWSGGGRAHTVEPYMATKHYARCCNKPSSLSALFTQYQNHLTGLLTDGLSQGTTAALDGVQTAILEARARPYKDLANSAQSETSRVLQTIPGVGPFVAASTLGEIQDVTRSPSARQLIAYAGPDTKIRQSGTALNSTGRLTKRGPGYLRRSLFIAASVARQHDAQFRALYDKKRAEGRTYKEATVVVARKLLQVARSVWLSGKEYALPELEEVA
jgi:transposase